MLEGSPVRFMLLQLHLRIYSMLSSPEIAFPAQRLTLHIHFHHQEKRAEEVGVGKIREQTLPSGPFGVKRKMVPINGEKVVVGVGK